MSLRAVLGRSNLLAELGIAHLHQHASAGVVAHRPAFGAGTNAPRNDINKVNMANKSAVQCEMIIGYLVPHRCENPSLGTCVKCGRGFCDEHTNQTRDGRVCLACQQGLDMPIALPIAAATFTSTDLDTFNRASLRDDDDRADMFSDLS